MNTPSHPNLQDAARLLDPVGDALSFTFEAMDVAEATLAMRYASKTAEPPGAFAALRPRFEVFRGRTTLLPGHCREILERLDAGQDPRPGTAAECCVALSETCLRAPLRHEWYTAFVWCFVEALGRPAAEHVLGDVSHDLDGYARSPLAQEAVAGLRRHLTDPDRAP